MWAAAGERGHQPRTGPSTAGGMSTGEGGRRTERDQGLITGQTEAQPALQGQPGFGQQEGSVEERYSWQQVVQSEQGPGGGRTGRRERTAGRHHRPGRLPEGSRGSFPSRVGVSERMGQGQSCRTRGLVLRPEGEGCEGCGPGALGRLCRAVGRQGSQPSRMEPGGAARGDSVDRQGSSEGGGVGGQGGGNCKCRKWVVTGGEGSQSSRGGRALTETAVARTGEEKAVSRQQDPRSPGDRGRPAKSHGRNPGDAPDPEDG